MRDLSITFLSPWWLLLLLVLPFVIWQSVGSLSGLGPTRRWIAIGARSLVLLLIACALADLQIVRKSDKLCTIFVLDQSQSIPQDQSEAAMEMITQSMAKRDRLEDPAGVVVFAKGARIETPPYAYPRTRVLNRIGTQLDRQYSDLESGLKLAIGSFPSDAARRIVLISDGNQNRGNAIAQALAAKQMGVPIDVIPIEYKYESEIMVDKLVVPPDLKKGDTANLKIVLRSARPASGTLRVKQVNDRTSKVVSEQKVQLQPGLNVLTKRLNIAEPDFYTYEAQFEPDANSEDRLARNNEATAFTWVRGEGKILLIEPSIGSHSFLAEKLRKDNIQVVTRTKDQLHESLGELRQYDTVIVANVGADQLDEAKQRIITANTKELGAGLIMIGGPDSFGAGGYVGSPMEEALPVNMEIKANKIRGKGALVLVMHACEIPEGNYWEKVIAKQAINTLSSTDECGILHYVGAAAWLFTLKPVGDKKAMLSKIDGLQPGDMPDFGSMLQAAHTALLKSDASTKHVIVISDGDPQDPPPSLLKAYRDAKITITTVAVAGHGMIEQNKMKFIADATKGRYYAVENPKALPQIYIKETRIVSRPLIYENAAGWSPQVVYPSEAVAGLPKGLPAIRGLVLTTAKPTAEVAIVSPLPADADRPPILALGQHGLGRTAAFTSDAGDKWAGEWRKSDLYAKFWSQLVRWSMRTAETSNLTISTQEKDGKVTVVVNALDKTQEALNFLNMQGNLVKPDAKGEQVKFRQTEPGKYEAEFSAEEYGTYFLRVGYRQADGKEGFASTGLTVSYPPEYRDLKSDRDLLENIATISGGRIVEWNNVAKTDFFTRETSPTNRLQDAWPLLLLLAMCVFLFDVATRRIAVDARDIQKLAKRVWAKVMHRPAEAVSAPMIGRLKAKKAEVDENIDQKRRFEADPAQLQAELELPTAEAPKTLEPPKPPPSTGLAPDARRESSSVTDRLLKAKKKVWEDRDKPGAKPE